MRPSPFIYFNTTHPHTQPTTTRLCYNGFWFAPEMELVMAGIAHTQKHCSGAVELSLYKARMFVCLKG